MKSPLPSFYTTKLAIIVPKMHLQIDTEALYILDVLQRAGFEGYIVGGAVRDLLRAADDPTVSVTDYDFTTNARPEEILQLFPNSFYENSFGTVSITREHIREQISGTFKAEETNTDTVKTTRIIDLHTASKIHE